MCGVCGVNSGVRSGRERSAIATVEFDASVAGLVEVAAGNQVFPAPHHNDALVPYVADRASQNTNLLAAVNFDAAARPYSNVRPRSVR
jgi:hypothetical protein